MKKRLLGMALVASACAITVACQPKAPKATPAPSCSESNESQTHCTNQDEIDSGAYGSDDTSQKEELVTVPTISEIQQVLEVALTQTPVEELQKNEPSTDVVVLEAVNPVEIKPQFQEESAQN